MSSGAGDADDDPSVPRAGQLRTCAEALQRIGEITRELGALQAELVDELGVILRDYPAPLEFLSTEVALALGIRDRDAEQLLERVRLLTSVLPNTYATLAAGRIGLEHANAVADAVVLNSEDTARAVDEQLAVPLTTRPFTPAQLYRKARQRALLLDPPAAKKEREQAIGERCLSRRLCSSGMASLRMYATAEDVASVWEAVTVLADAAATPRDVRDLGNRRVDVLVDLSAAILETGALPELRPVVSADGAAVTGEEGAEGAGVETRGTSPRAGSRVRPRGRRGRRSVLVNVTMPYTALVGADAPCELAGMGPISAEVARMIAADAAPAVRPGNRRSGGRRPRTVRTAHPPG